MATSGHRGLARAGALGARGERAEAASLPPAPSARGGRGGPALGTPWQELCSPRSIAVPLLGNLISLFTE